MFLFLPTRWLGVALKPDGLCSPLGGGVSLWLWVFITPPLWCSFRLCPCLERFFFFLTRDRKKRKKSNVSGLVIDLVL